MGCEKGVSVERGRWARVRVRDNVEVRDMSVEEWGKKSGLRETEEERFGEREGVGVREKDGEK